MSTYAFITSLDQPYYDHIGKHMVASFIKYAPENFQLHIYAENMTEQFPQSDKLVIVDWHEKCEADWRKFAVKCMPDTGAKKFGKKGWTTIHAWENIDADYIIWFDADILFKKNFTESVFEKTLDSSKLVGLFDQKYQSAKLKSDEKIWPSAESGYVIVNTRHSSFKDFVAEYRRLYEVDRKPPEIYRWWDNQILMLAANKFYSEVNDLSETRYKDKTQTPLNHSPLATYFSHFKGKSKKRLEEDTMTEFTGNA